MLHKYWDAAESFHKGYNVVQVSQAEAERAFLYQKIYELQALLEAAGTEEQKEDVRRQLAECQSALEQNERDSEQ
jgi:DNA-binding GntR family transcriptional regulator